MLYTVFYHLVEGIYFSISAQYLLDEILEVHMTVIRQHCISYSECIYSYVSLFQNHDKLCLKLMVLDCSSN